MSNQKNKQLVIHFLLLILLIGVGLVARLYKLTTPLADWHSWRQADTASVTREFVKHTYPIWEPRYHDLSNIPSGLDNLQGYRMVEFPLVNYLTAQLVKAFPQYGLVVISRLVSIALSLAGIVALYGLIYLLSRRKTLAFGSSLVMATLPYSVFYSRVILPEPALIGTQLVGLCLFAYWLHWRQHRLSWFLYILSLTATAISLLLKPTGLFIAPVYIVIAIHYLGWSTFVTPSLWVFGAITAAPLFVWRKWIKEFPEGIPASSWLLNGNGIRLRPAWWRWLFGDRLGRLILGGWGVVFAVTGLISKLRTSLVRKTAFDQVTLIWSASMFAYLVIFATGNVQHDYYQAILIPIVAILFARGFFWLWHLPRTYVHRWFSRLVLIVLVVLSYALAWWEVKGYYNINNPAIVAAGQKVDQITPTESVIIAPYGGDTAFLFQTNRRGWPVGGEIVKRIEQGATHYVSTARDDETKQLMQKYTVIEQNDQYVIIDLTRPASD